MSLTRGARRGVAALLSIAAFGRAGSARAQHVEYKASVTLTAAYTQLISDAPASSVPSSANYAGASISLTPSLIALLDTPRTENTLTYAFSLTVPLPPQIGVNPTGVTYANRLSYTGHYALSEITNLSLGVNVTESPINTFVPSQDPTVAPVQTTPAGSEYLVSTGLTEGVTRQISDRNVFNQAASFLYGHPFEAGSTPSQTFSGTNSFAVGHTFLRDSLGVALTNQVNDFTASPATSTSAAVPASSAWVNTLAANWQHSFSEAFSMYLVAGATQTLTPDAATFMQIQPTGSAMLNYNFLLATAGLAYSHGVAPNVATATINLADTVSLRFAAPIGLTGLTTMGTVAYTHAVPIGTSLIACTGSTTTCTASTQTNPSDVFAGDLGLDYHPERVPTLAVGLRGQVARQLVSEATESSFFRWTAALNVTYSYPNVRAAATRPQLSPLYSAQPPAASDVISTDRFFGAPVAGPDPEEPPPKPKGP